MYTRKQKEYTIEFIDFIINDENFSSLDIGKYKRIIINGNETRYLINSLGFVLNTNFKNRGEYKVKKHHYDKRGYLTTTLHDEGKDYNCRIHRLVAEAFIPNIYNKEEVNHKKWSEI